MAAAEKDVEAEVQSSVRDDILAAVKEVNERDTAPEKVEKPEKTADERARDEAGRFAAKEKADDSKRTGEAAARRTDPAAVVRTDLAPAAPEGAPVAARSAGQPAPESALAAPGSGAAAGVQPEVTGAPQAWSYAAKAKWAELPTEIRAEISKREADVHKGMTRMDDERTFARAMHQSVSPYVAMFRADGVSAPQAVANVMNVAYQLRTGDPITKARTLSSLAQQFGIDLNLLAPSQQQGSADPTVNALHQTVTQLQQQLAEQRQQAQQAAQEAEGRRAQEIQQAIHAFASDPKHPHFNAVMPTMAALIQNGEAKDMEEAYQMAIYARPDIRQQLQAAEAAQRTAEVDAQRKAEEARRKGKSVRGGPGGAMPAAPNPNASVREDLEAAFAEARGRI